MFKIGVGEADFSNTQKRPTNTQKRPTNAQKRPTNTQKRPTNTQKRPSNTQKRPTNTQKRPTNRQKRPTNRLPRFSKAYEHPRPPPCFPGKEKQKEEKRKKHRCAFQRRMSTLVRRL